MNCKLLLPFYLMFFVASCGAAVDFPETVSIRFLVSKVVWPYPIMIEGENESGRTESLSKAVSLVVVESSDLAKFEKKGEGLVTAFVSFAAAENVPHAGDHYVARFRTSELWKINLPADPKTPPDSFAVLEDAASLKREDQKKPAPEAERKKSP